MPNQAAEVAICAPASDWPGGRDRGREGDAPSLVRTLVALLKLRTSDSSNSQKSNSKRGIFTDKDL